MEVVSEIENSWLGAFVRGAMQDEVCVAIVDAIRRYIIRSNNDIEGMKKKSERETKQKRSVKKDSGRRFFSLANPAM